MLTRYTSADQWADAKDGVIPAPYALEEGEQIIDQILKVQAVLDDHAAGGHTDVGAVDGEGYF